MALRRFPIHPGAIYGVAKELRAAAEDFRPIVIAGADGPAGQLRDALLAGGDHQAIRDLAGRELSAYDVEGAGVLVYAVEGSVGPRDETALKLADRKGVETICILVAEGGPTPVDVPFVLATNVVRVRPGKPPPVGRIAELVAERADERSYMWAARLPVLRKPVVEHTIRKFARQNGVLGVAIFIPGADMPALTLNQIRMVFRIAAAYGEQIDRDRALEILAVIGAGLGFRAVAREALGFIPGVGWAIKGGIAYAGTRALGRAAVAYFEAGGQKRIKEAVGSVRSRS
ncbi:MAG TPA: hypothetical protein VGJ34_10090 [Gaiellaceae bacterium]